MSNLPPIIQVILAVVVVVAGAYDILYRRIPNWLVLFALIVGFALNAWLFSGLAGESALTGLRHSALGFGLAFAVNFPLYLLHARGAGDVKLMAAIGALVGWSNWLVIFVITGVLGGVLALVLMLARGRFRRTIWNVGFILSELVRFRAPHLSREELDVTSSKGFRLPQGAVIALGCLMLLGAGRLAGI